MFPKTNRQKNKQREKKSPDAQNLLRNEQTPRDIQDQYLYRILTYLKLRKAFFKIFRHIDLISIALLKYFQLKKKNQFSGIYD